MSWPQWKVVGSAAVGGWFDAEFQIVVTGMDEHMARDRVQELLCQNEHSEVVMVIERCEQVIP